MKKRLIKTALIILSLSILLQTSVFATSTPGQLYVDQNGYIVDANGNYLGGYVDQSGNIIGYGTIFPNTSPSSPSSPSTNQPPTPNNIGTTPGLNPGTQEPNNPGLNTGTNPGNLGNTSNPSIQSTPKPTKEEEKNKKDKPEEIKEEVKLDSKTNLGGVILTIISAIILLLIIFMLLIIVLKSKVKLFGDIYYNFSNKFLGSTSKGTFKTGTEDITLDDRVIQKPEFKVFGDEKLIAKPKHDYNEYEEEDTNINTINNINKEEMYNEHLENTTNIDNKVNPENTANVINKVNTKENNEVELNKLNNINKTDFEMIEKDELFSTNDIKEREEIKEVNNNKTDEAKPKSQIINQEDN